MHFFVGDFMELENIIKLLYKEASKGLRELEVPVAALIVNSKDELIAIARNNRQTTNNVLGHAEILAIQKAEKKIQDWRLNGCSMYVSLAPCRMCQEVIRESRLDHVYYLCDSEGIPFIIPNIEKLNVNKETKEKFSDLLTTFFDNMR